MFELLKLLIKKKFEVLEKVICEEFFNFVFKIMEFLFIELFFDEFMDKRRLVEIGIVVFIEVYF